MNNFYLRIAVPVMVATLCFFTAIAGCQARDAEQQPDEATSVQIPESGSPGAVLPASASRTGASAARRISPRGPIATTLACFRCCSELHLDDHRRAPLEASRRTYQPPGLLGSAAVRNATFE
jgi:hypothetical protein